MVTGRVLTRAQREALYAVWKRGEPNQAPTYRAFRRRALRPSYDVCVMVPWCGMWLGIEPDGYTHS
jgi:hypothetical protein